MQEKPTKAYLHYKRILAIDYGRKFTGLAMFRPGDDPFPLPWGRIAYQSDEQLMQELALIIDDEFVDILVIGIPFFTDGKESTMTKTIKAFVDQCRRKFSIPIYAIDETLTTFEAEERMKNDPRYNFKVDLTKIDELSATIILEEFVKDSSDA